MIKVAECSVSEAYTETEVKPFTLVENNGLAFVTTDTKEATFLEGEGILTQYRPEQAYELVGCSLIPLYVSTLQK